MTLESILLGALGFVIAGVIGWWRGRATGTRDTQAAEKVKDYERVRENIKARERADSESHADSAVDRLRRDYTRRD